jgi:hypothetical protein
MLRIHICVHSTCSVKFTQKSVLCVRARVCLFSPPVKGGGRVSLMSNMPSCFPAVCLMKFPCMKRKTSWSLYQYACTFVSLCAASSKTKYVPVTKKSHSSYPHYLEVGPYKFQAVHSLLTSLGSDINCNNDFNAEIPKRILAASRCFHGLRKHQRSHLTSKNTKILMYKVLIRPLLTYASETWTLSKINERRLSLFERKVLRCIF